MKAQILKQLLEAEEYRSGEEISQILGISRSAIWKYINKLRQEGYEIDSITNKGYKIVQFPKAFIHDELEYLLKPYHLVDEVFVYDTIDSTNQEAKRIALNGVTSALVISEEQTKGKGRRGRAWVSNKGTGLYMSMLLRPTIKPTSASMLTLVAGLAVHRALNELTGIQNEIKWPNDIVMNGKKVCGILTEMSSEIDQINYVVIGIGLNIQSSKWDNDLLERATSINHELQKEVDRKQILVNIIKYFTQLYEQFTQTESLDFMINAYNQACINIDKHVQVEMNQEQLSGIVDKINAQGALILRLSSGELVEIHSGEVSIRGLYGYVE